MAKWKTTRYPGVRYREHSTRMHGRQKDRYYSIRFQHEGQRKEEGVGWASGGMTEAKAFVLMQELKEELRTGKSSGRLADRRKAREAAEQAALAEKKRQERASTTYEQFYREYYLPAVQEKKPSTLAREKSLHKLWILPVIGKLPIKDVSDFHVLKIKKTMTRKGRAPRTVQYAFTCTQMVFSLAIRLGYYTGNNPVQVIPKNSRPKFDNRKTRFLSHEEADRLLKALAKRSQQVHDMTLLSLHCGLRFGEIANLRWGDIDLSHGLITLRGTKSGKDRTVTMTSRVMEIFRDREKAPGELVFPARTGKPQKMISRTFPRTVDEIGLNDGIDPGDRKQKVTFHTCRHTCASWLVMAGVPLYTVQKILGHSTFAMTERYAHLAPQEFKAAANLLERELAASMERHENRAAVVDIKSA